MSHEPFQLEFADAIPIDTGITEMTGPAIEKFGFKWFLTMSLTHYNMSVPHIFLNCERIDDLKKWDVHVRCRTPKGRWIRGQVFDSGVEELKETSFHLEDYGTLDEMRHYKTEVNISKIIIGKVFDYSTPKEYTDMILEVGGVEFHVAREVSPYQFLSLLLFQTLTTLSDHFLNLFNQNPTSHRFTLDSISADQVQDFLEVLYHKSDITALNILNLITASHRFNHPIILKRSVAFFGQIPDEMISLKSKIKLADSLQSTELLEVILKPRHSARSLLQAVPENLNDLHPKTIVKVLEKIADTKIDKF